MGSRASSPWPGLDVCVWLAPLEAVTFAWSLKIPPLILGAVKDSRERRDPGIYANAGRRAYWGGGWFCSLPGIVQMFYGGVARLGMIGSEGLDRPCGRCEPWCRQQLWRCGVITGFAFF